MGWRTRRSGVHQLLTEQVFPRPANRVILPRVVILPPMLYKTTDATLGLELPRRQWYLVKAHKLLHTWRQAPIPSTMRCVRFASFQYFATRLYLIDESS